MTKTQNHEPLHADDVAAIDELRQDYDRMCSELARVIVGQNAVIEQLAIGLFARGHVLLMGVTGAFLTGDLFNLYVWFEVMLISSFVLLTLGGKRDQLEGGIKYVTLNLMSSALFLAAIGMVYGLTGTLNMAHLALELPAVENQGLVTVLARSILS